MVTRWTVDQEVVGSNPTHGRNKTRYPGLLSTFGKMSTGFRWPRSSTWSWYLKYGSMSFADWLWSVIVPVLGLKTISDLLDINSTPTGIAYSYLTAPHSCNYMSYVRHVAHAARSSKNYLWLLGLEYAKFSLHEKWNNCAHPCRIVIV